ncbi:hypothetical protein CANCADRAFT_31926 [Tortispora caseinolytica NRRL Y-17796]|uniref:B30.2/SPRY domain-containing protein n=1 Tax=Tortispora caseinolytica NRRL Y-17796 TaxID=767744 RepID=A0A1E4THH9_9ASCO|nr:hypothetical protein CANCADRAFT_31926 [Tortispora caseinolytica NRRL Y-17796]
MGCCESIPDDAHTRIRSGGVAGDTVALQEQRTGRSPTTNTINAEDPEQRSPSDPATGRRRDRQMYMISAAYRPIVELAPNDPALIPSDNAVTGPTEVPLPAPLRHAVRRQQRSEHLQQHSNTNGPSEIASPMSGGATPLPSDAGAFAIDLDIQDLLGAPTVLLPPPDYPIQWRRHNNGAVAIDDPDKEEAARFCANNPLVRGGVEGIELGKPETLALESISRFKGTISNLPGKCVVRASPKCRDTTLLSNLPVYSPRHPRKRVYYEATVTHMGPKNSSLIVLGYSCKPYPQFRLPGWNRGSLSVHSDDGMRYVCDHFAGKPFVKPFSNENSTYGIGMDFEQRSVIFTENGKVLKGWSLVMDEKEQQLDGHQDPATKIEGLEGDHDVYIALGVYGDVGVVVNFGLTPFQYQYGV